jgi:hypothetical protein
MFQLKVKIDRSLCEAWNTINLSPIGNNLDPLLSMIRRSRNRFENYSIIAIK